MSAGRYGREPVAMMCQRRFLDHAIGWGPLRRFAHRRNCRCRRTGRRGYGRNSRYAEATCLEMTFSALFSTSGNENQRGSPMARNIGLVLNCMIYRPYRVTQRLGRDGTQVGAVTADLATAIDHRHLAPCFGGVHRRTFSSWGPEPSTPRRGCRQPCVLLRTGQAAQLDAGLNHAAASEHEGQFGSQV